MFRKLVNILGTSIKPLVHTHYKPGSKVPVIVYCALCDKTAESTRIILPGCELGSGNMSDTIITVPEGWVKINTTMWCSDGCFNSYKNEKRFKKLLA